jgi:Flp pilus assembly protein TadG
MSARSAARLSSQSRAGKEGNKSERMIAKSLQRGNASISTIATAIQGLAAGQQQTTATATWAAEVQNAQTIFTIGGMNEEEKEAQISMLKRKYMSATAEGTDSKKRK